MKILIALLAHNSKAKIMPQILEKLSKMKIPNDVEVKYLLCCQDTENKVIEQYKKTDKEIFAISVDEAKFERVVSHLIKGWDELEIFRVVEMRNAIIKKAMDYDAVMFCDGDILQPEDALSKLIEADKEDIGGWYFMWKHPTVIAFKYPEVVRQIAKSEKSDPKQMLENIEGLEAPALIPEGEIECPGDIEQKTILVRENVPDVMVSLKLEKPFKIGGLGMGCRLMKKSIYSRFKFRMDKNHPNPDDTVFTAEEIRNGIKVYCHPKVYCEHLGKYTELSLKYKKKMLKELGL